MTETVGQFLDRLTTSAKGFSAAAPAQVQRDQHMHRYRGPLLDRAITDAVIVAFCNQIAAERGVDLALYASDLNPEAAP